ncbi:calcium-binding protein [Kordiimonas lacus]|uniref:Ca2+-binding protein, RTX toxin-related n=1 Tax=Kordiimonas lacus TaxID=637679 RepID=A0A1G6SXN6_9PROT|nr:calcium-binding protein [Kordiimonas lacus]SDD21598.1 Ca2+-binding protein, RTX toxin-related [Kordiimonas lacus]
MPISNANDLLAQANNVTGYIDPSVAIGLQGITDTSTQLPFLDLTKMMRPWFGVSDTEGYVDYESFRPLMTLDENGWPTEMVDGFHSIQTIFDWDLGPIAEGANAGRAGVYVLQYEGEGDINIFGVSINILSETDGKIVFENTSGGTFGFEIANTDPANTGDYIRDISIVREEHLELYQAGAVFNPTWLDLVDDMREFRFMDWMNTNHSPISEWSDRPQVDDFTYAANGVPIEVIVQLANEAGTDIWINIPHLATDDYVENMALYIRDNLDPALKVTVEFSNEAWNTIFAHSAEMDALGQAAFPGVEPSYQVRLDWYGMRASQVMKIFTEVYGDRAEDSLVRVAGSMTDNTWVTEQVLTASSWQQTDPEGYEPPHTYFDAVAVTTYFGGAVPLDDTHRQTILDAIDDPAVDAFDVTANLLRDPNVESSIPQVLDALATQQAFAADYGLALLSYEGGQHIHHYAGTNGSSLILSDFLADFVRSDQMAELYQELFDGWQAVGGEAFMQFVDVSAPGQFGSWGLRAFLEDTNPRAELIDTLNATVSPWWESRGGTHFQQGVQAEGTSSDDTLIGTLQEDYLVGSSGDDVLVGGAGDDGLHGGDGTDIVLLSGTADDYEISVEGYGYRVVGPDGSDRLVAVETIEFANGTQIQLDPLPVPSTSGGSGGGGGGGGVPTTGNHYEISNYIFGHSLVNYQEVPETAMPYWLHQLADTAGNDYAFTGQFGFLRLHDDLNPVSQWGFAGVPNPWNSESGTSFADADFTTVTITPGNFIQGLAPTEPFEGENPEGTTPLQSTLTIIDWVQEQEPGAVIYIYESWPDMAARQLSFPPTEAEFAIYHDYAQGEFHDWFETYVDAIREARPDVVVELIPVGSLISQMLTDDSLGLGGITPSDLYVDADPHGTPTMYFLSSLINYTALYGQPAPDTFQVPDDVHPLVQQNYAAIADFVWQAVGDELAHVEPVEGPGTGGGTPLPGPDPEIPVYTFQGDDGDNLFIGYDDHQRFLGEGGFDTADFSGSAGGIAIDLGTGTGTAGDAIWDEFHSIEAVIGTNDNDTISGGDEANALSGRGGTDILFGAGGADTLHGGDGEDLLLGGDGDDRLYGDTDTAASDTLVGGDGNDHVNGSGGNDLLIGGGAEVAFSVAGNGYVGGGEHDGSDYLIGEEGDDTIIGGGWVDGIVAANGQFDEGEALTYGTDSDTMKGGAGDDVFHAASGDDIIMAGSGADRVLANAGDDKIYAGSGSDWIDGGLGADLIFGGNGNDTIFAGNGEDVIWGGAGDDLLSGGGAADLFVFGAGHGQDVIMDFDINQDTLKLRAHDGYFADFDAVVAAASDHRGSLLIDLGNGSVLIEGYSVADLATMAIEI